LGLFNNNYNKPGPGISKDLPEQKPFPRFWSILFRKFGNLVKLNLIFCIPLIIVAVLIVFLGNILPSVLIFLPLVLVSPFVAGLTIVTRNYAREEHAFVLSDFIDAVKLNWIPFLINGMICYIAYVIFSVSITYYAAQIQVNYLFFIPLSLCIGISILFIFSQYYIPIMIVTFDLKLKQIYKNAFIFSIVGLWKNLLLTVILAVTVFIFDVLFRLMPLTLIIAIALSIIIMFAFCMFLINFMVYPLIHKMMIQPNIVKTEERSSDVDFKDHAKFN